MSIWTLPRQSPPWQQRAFKARGATYLGVNWGTRFGKSSSHSEQIVHFGGSHENQKLKQVINILARLPRRGLMLISLSHLCFLFFPWHSLIFHNAGNSTLFDQNALKLSNEFQLSVYYSSILAWRIPKDRGAWQAAVHGVTTSRTWRSDYSIYSIYSI